MRIVEQLFVLRLGLTLDCLRSYNTTSNRTRVIKTPGGDLRLLHIKKRGTVPKCGDCGSKLSGVSQIRIRRAIATT